jgi:UDP-GlcNAc3NAcA epimerase
MVYSRSCPSGLNIRDIARWLDLPFRRVGERFISQAEDGCNFMRIALVIGNRPHFIKSAPLLKELRKFPEIETVIIHSGQHYDPMLSDAFLKDFDFPLINENLAVGSASCSIQTGVILQRLDPVYRKFQPDCVISMGDTNTTLAAALAAYQMHIPNAHIEAGMRENIWRPEEMNKKIADHCADYLFAPIPRAVQNLITEGIDESRIFLTGDITLDTFESNKTLAFGSIERLRSLIPDLPESYDLVTMHRAETVDNPEIINEILMAFDHWPNPLVFPVHPRTAKRLTEFGFDGILSRSGRILRLSAQSYLNFLTLLLHSNRVITDSSGVLKEAFYAGKLCLVIDDSTEYREIFKSKAAYMIGRKTESIMDSLKSLDNAEFPKDKPQIFGTGKAAVEMVRILMDNATKHK